MKTLFLLGSFFLFSGCQMSYYAKSAFHQAKILAAREDINKSLDRSDLTPQQKEKLKIAIEARDFALNQLGLAGKGNYTQYVQLDRPFVSWVVNAAKPWELAHHQFKYLIVGAMPYKGFFSEKEAQEEKKRLEKQGLDVYLRGVSAYSTLGWFKDPVLSSMLRYEDHDLVNTIIHELVHSTLYIKNSADFNERMAVFIGNLGTELFYQQKEGTSSQTLQKIMKEYEEEKIFSRFISTEIRKLEEFYKNLPQDQRNDSVKRNYFQGIKDRFEEEVKPFVSENSFQRFQKTEFNNAYIILFKTYNQDLDQFEKAYQKLDSDLKKFLEKMKSFEKEKDPFKALQEFVSK